MVKIYSRYNPPKAAGVSTGYACKTPTLTQQHFKEQCDVNNIINRFTASARASGASLSDLLPPVTSKDFADVSNVGDFLDASNRVARMVETFEALPADVRRRYQDQPSVFVQALNSPEELRFLSTKGIISGTQLNEYFSQLYSGSSQTSQNSQQSVQNSEKQQTEVNQ